MKRSHKTTEERIAELHEQHDWVMENVLASEGRDDACIGIDAEIERLKVHRRAG